MFIHKAVICVSALVFIPGTAQASSSLIGDEVLIEHHCCTTIFGNVWDTNSATVAADASDLTTVTASTDHISDYSVDVGVSGFYVSFLRDIGFSPFPYHGVVVSDLDFSPSTTVFTVDVSTNLGAWTDSRISFGPDWVSLDWKGLFVGATSYFDVTINTIATSVPVTIDIKPGSDPNCFNINGHGVIPVAILGSNTFDVLDIDTSVTSGALFFAGLEVRVRGKKGPLCHGEYSNGDGFLDLVCQFEDDPSMWTPDSSTATLTGTLLDGTEFEGTDSICVVP